MKKVLFVATVVKHHIMSFHIPYLEWFKENGYETHVCARNDFEDKGECNIPYCDKYYDLPFVRSPINFSNIASYIKLKKIIDSNEYDIIHCHTPVGGVLARLAARKMRSKGTKVIYTAHGFHFYKGAPLKNWILFYSIEKFLAEYTDVLITINNEDYDRARKSFKTRRIEYIPGIGIDIKKYSEIIIDKSAKCAELGIPSNVFVALSVGELNKNKNHEVIIKALAKIKDLNWFYVICGQGDRAVYLKQLAISLGVSDKVKFLGFRSDVYEICKVADVFVFPSYREGLSVSLMEAMAAGLPIICSKIRGNSDLIEDGKGGYLVAPDDVEGFVTAFNKIYQNANLYEGFKRNNIKTVNRFSLNNVTNKVTHLYREL